MRYRVEITDVYEIEAEDEQAAEDLLLACRDNGNHVSTRTWTWCLTDSGEVAS